MHTWCINNTLSIVLVSIVILWNGKPSANIYWLAHVIECAFCITHCVDKCMTKIYGAIVADAQSVQIISASLAKMTYDNITILKVWQYCLHPGKLMSPYTSNWITQGCLWVSWLETKILYANHNAIMSHSTKSKMIIFKVLFLDVTAKLDFGLSKALE